MRIFSKLILTLITVITVIIFFAFASPKLTLMSSDNLELSFPEDVQTVLKTSYFDFHTNGSKSEKALEKLNFNK